MQLGYCKRHNRVQQRRLPSTSSSSFAATRDWRLFFDDRNLLELVALSCCCCGNAAVGTRNDWGREHPPTNEGAHDRGETRTCRAEHEATRLSDRANMLLNAMLFRKRSVRRVFAAWFDHGPDRRWFWGVSDNIHFCTTTVPYGYILWGPHARGHTLHQPTPAHHIIPTFPHSHTDTCSSPNHLAPIT